MSEPKTKAIKDLAPGDHVDIIIGVGRITKCERTPIIDMADGDQSYLVEWTVVDGMNKGEEGSEILGGKREIAMVDLAA